MDRIAIIVPYIGKLQDSFDFWLSSAAFNKTIDFLLFTDANIENVPSNVHVHRFTFEQLHELIQRNFDFEIRLSKPYKFCDFRPAFGEIFKDYIDGYEFWGYTDLDVIYGDLRKYLTEDMLGRYDHIFGHGHFSLYRNTDIVNSEYRKVRVPTYKQVFTYDDGRAFDEYCGTAKHWYDNLPEKFCESICFDDIDCMKYSFISQMRRKEYAGCKNTIFSYEDGRLFRIFEKDGKVVKNETMYVHFQKRNMKVNTLPDSRFIMIPNSYEKYEEITTTKRLEKLGHRPLFYPKRYLLKWRDFKSKIYKLYLKRHTSEYGYPMLPKDTSQFYVEKLD